MEPQVITTLLAFFQAGGQPEKVDTIYCIKRFVFKISLKFPMTVPYDSKILTVPRFRNRDSWSRDNTEFTDLMYLSEIRTNHTSRRESKKSSFSAQKAKTLEL